MGIMKTEKASFCLSSTEVLSPSFIIRNVKKEEKEKELNGDDDKNNNDDEENHQWIEFFENITNNINLDDKDEGHDDDDDHNKGVTAGRSTSSLAIKTEEEVPDSIPSKSSMIGMEEEVEEEVFTSIISNTLVWGDGTITGGVATCEDQQQVKKGGKKKEEEEEAATAEKEDDNGNDRGYESRAEGISPKTDGTFPTAASTNHCVRRKFNSNNNKDYNDVDGDNERKPPPKKKIRVLAAAEEDINIKADEVHT